MSPPKKKPPDLVRCLKCQKEFPSKDRKVNRICPGCSKENDNLSIRVIRAATQEPTPSPEAKKTTYD